MNITILSFLEEMQSFVNVSFNLLQKASKSNITSKNNSELNILLNQWQNGEFDEDPDTLVFEIAHLL